VVEGKDTINVVDRVAECKKDGYVDVVCVMDTDGEKHDQLDFSCEAMIYAPPPPLSLTHTHSLSLLRAISLSFTYSLSLLALQP
jgi:hypothetical protein